MSQKWPPNGTPRAPKIDINSKKYDLGSLWGRSWYSMRQMFKKYATLGAPATSKTELPLQRELDFHFSWRARKMTKNLSQKWPLGHLLGAFGAQNDQNWPLKDTSKKWSKKALKNRPKKVSFFWGMGSNFRLILALDPKWTPTFKNSIKKWRLGHPKWSFLGQKWPLYFPNLSTHASKYRTT